MKVAVGRVSITGKSREGNYSCGVTIPAEILRETKWRNDNAAPGSISNGGFSITWYTSKGT
jgi:hypothetical protein